MRSQTTEYLSAHMLATLGGNRAHLKLFGYALACGNVVIGFCVAMCSDRISINVAGCVWINSSD